MAALAQATAPPAARSLPVLAEHAVLRAMEAVAAVLVVAEVVILLMGVVSRFVFDRPLVWSDELASLLFLWLAMVGAAIALSRGAHMRLSTITAMMSPAWRLRLDALAVGVPLVFLALLFSPRRGTTSRTRASSKRRR